MKTLLKVPTKEEVQELTGSGEVFWEVAQYLLRVHPQAMWELYEKGTLLKILASKEQLILAEAASMQRSGVDFRESLAVALGNSLWEPPEEDRPKASRLSQKRWMILRDWIEQVVEMIPSWVCEIGSNWCQVTYLPSVCG